VSKCQTEVPYTRSINTVRRSLSGRIYSGISRVDRVEVIATSKEMIAK